VAPSAELGAGKWILRNSLIEDVLVDFDFFTYPANTAIFPHLGCLVRDGIRQTKIPSFPLDHS
jgi:hypothetical protein